MRTILATILESAFCIFFRTFQINNFDESWAVEFAWLARPVNMPIVAWEGLNHAFPLGQSLHLNAWTRMERQILITVQTTQMAHDNINIKCQEELAKNGFLRSRRAIQCKRRKMELTAISSVPSRNENSSEDSVFCWSLVEESISTRIVGEFYDQGRGFQVDTLFEALLWKGQPRRRRECAAIIRDLFPRRVQLWRPWSDYERAIAIDVLAKKGPNCSTSELAIALSDAINTSCGTRRSISSCASYIPRLKQATPHKWTGKELAIFNLVEMEHHDKSTSELGSLLSRRLLADLNIDRKPSTCTVKIQEIRRYRELAGEAEDEDDATEATMKESTATFTVSAIRPEAMAVERPSGQIGVQDVDDWPEQKRQRSDDAREDIPVKRRRLDAEKRKFYFRVPKDDPRQKRHCTAADLKKIINDSVNVRPNSLFREQGYYRHITAPRYFNFKGGLRVTQAGKEVIRLWSRQAQLEPKDNPDDWDPQIWTPAAVHRIAGYSKSLLIDICGRKLFGFKEQEFVDANTSVRSEPPIDASIPESSGKLVGHKSVAPASPVLSNALYDSFSWRRQDLAYALRLPTRTCGTRLPDDRHTAFSCTPRKFRKE